jgi:hypothetical protein
LVFSELPVSPKLVLAKDPSFMEETGVCHFIPTDSFSPSYPPANSAARSLGPQQRQNLAVQALAGAVPITELAQHAHVSRKFVHQQKNIAQEALADAFESQGADDRVLFQLPVTKPWLQQLTLGLVLIGRCSVRGVVELLRDLFDVSMSVGTVHNIVHAMVPRARDYNNRQDLSHVRIGDHDELFQGAAPVLTGIDVDSGYCYLLSQEEHRDADTWAVRLLELHERGFQPEAVVADGANGLRAGQAEALPDVPCRSDVFHAVREVRKIVTILENQAYKAMNACRELQHKQASRKHRGLPTDRARARRLANAVREETRAIALADHVALLARWLRVDVLGLAGPAHAERLALYDFIVSELEARLPQAASHLHKLTVYLKNQRDDLLAFAAELDHDLAGLADAFEVAPALVRDLFAVCTLAPDHPQRWQRDAQLRSVLGQRYFLLVRAVESLRRRTVRCSSLVENLNGRLRGYFYLRRHLGNDYLALLQFFLNHRRKMRSDHAECVGKSPAELLSGQSHRHWLELLGYRCFSRS